MPVGEVSFLYSGREGNRNVLNRHKFCPPTVTACTYLFALFSLAGDGRGRKVSWGNIFSSLQLHSFRSSLPQKNIVLKLMILNGPLINLLAPSPPSWCTWQRAVKWNSRRGSKLFDSPASERATLKKSIAATCTEAYAKGKIMESWRREKKIWKSCFSVTVTLQQGHAFSLQAQSNKP